MIFPERSADYYSKMTDRTVIVTLIVNLIVLAATLWSGIHV